MIMFFVLLFSLSTLSSAQQKAKKIDEVRIGVSVNDSFTNVGLPAHVAILNSDSIIIDSATCKVYQGNSFHTFYIPSVSGKYTLRATCRGYKTGEKVADFDFSEKKYGWGFPTLKLQRLPNGIDSLKSVNLDEVIIRGTRLQVAYRGDTLVYNAEAFNIPEGAMLDALVRQLPGAEMKTNGDVYINGKRLDYITLNGNDFYKGKNKVILENLPYFVVKELQVYYKNPPFALVKPTTDDEKDYVLDVVMKREYNVGTVGNAEVGTGTDERWKAKMFGLRYDDYTRLSMFANANNVNENRTPGDDGDWSPDKQQRGLLTTRQTGMNLNLNNAKKTFSLNQSALFEWNGQNITSQQRSENFSADGNILGGASSLNRTKKIQFNNQTKIEMKIKKVHLSTNHNITYRQGKGTYMSADSTFQKSLVNTNKYQSLNDSRGVYGNGSLNLGTMLINSNPININANYSFNSQTRGRTHTQHYIGYMNTGTVEERNDSRDNTTRQYFYRINLSQSFRISPRIVIMYEVGYEQNGKGGDNNFYRIYSDTDPLQTIIDSENSYDYFNIGRAANAMAYISYRWKNTSVNISTRYTYTYDRITYHNAGLDTVARRSYGVWNPNFSLQHKWGKNRVGVSYYGYTSQPNFAQLMPLIDNTNTLYIRLNNPNMMAQYRNIIKIDLNMRPGGMLPTWWMKYELETISHAWGNRMNYDTNTGAYTSMADNVDGNWNTKLSFGMNGAIGKKRRWQYDVNAVVGYVHSVDFSIAYDGADNRHSRIGTIRSETKWKLSYRNGNFSAGTMAKFSGNFSHEKEYGLRDMNVCEYQMGINGQYTVPVVKLTIGTDINLYSRSGFTNATMNSNDWIWNATISRSLYKGRMVVKLDLYDILHQLSTRSYSVNAQSRVETYYNSIPHYMMLSLGYRFAKSPKK